MNCTEIRHRLDDFADRRLPPDTRTAVEAHLAVCPPCHQELSTLHSVREAVAALPKAILPAADLWPRIERRIAGRRRMGEGQGSGLHRHRPWAPLVAAAAVVIAISSGLIFWPTEPRSPRPRPELSSASADASLPSVREEIQQLLDRQHSQLGPESVAVIEANLETIDRAFEEIRSAIQTHPENRELNLLLASARHKEAQLLRQLTELARNSYEEKP